MCRYTGTNIAPDLPDPRPLEKLAKVKKCAAPREWLAAMGDPLLAEADIDRLASDAYQLVIDPPLCRQRQGPGREAHSRPPGGSSGPRTCFTVD
jgi:hypothetical protein